MRSKCSGNDPCQNCAKKGSDCLYVGRKRKRTLQHSPHDQTVPQYMLPASEATVGRTDRSQRDFEDLTIDMPSTISREFDNMVDSAGEDGHGVNWAAPASHQDAFDSPPTSTHANILQNDMLSSFITSGPRWIGPSIFNYSGTVEGEIMPINEAIFDASGSWTNWLPCDQIPRFSYEPVSVVAPESTSASQCHQWNQASPQPPQSPQVARSQTFQLPNPRGSSHMEGLEPAQLEHSARTMPSVPVGDSHRRRHPSQSGSKRNLYVAGAGARSTQIDRARRERRKSLKSSNASSDESPQSHSEASSAFHLHESMDVHTLHANFDATGPSLVTQQDYNEILSKIEVLWSNGVSILHPFSNNHFPSLRTLSYLIHLYFENFHPVYPFLNKWMLGVPGWGCCMTLATAAIGARYMSSSISHASSNALHGLLYNVLVQDVSLVKN